MCAPKKTRDIWDFFEESDRKRAARPRIIKCSSWVSLQLTRLWTAWLSPIALYHKAYRFTQRRIRGFDDSELWSLDDTILRFILPRLKRFRATDRAGWPGPEQIFDIDYEEFQKLNDLGREDLNQRSIEEWDRILDKMIRALELQIEHDGIFQKLNPEWKEGDPRRDQYIKAPELEDEYKEGWALFIKWFHALWD